MAPTKHNPGDICPLAALEYIDLTLILLICGNRERRTKNNDMIVHNITRNMRVQYCQLAGIEHYYDEFFVYASCSC